MHLEIIQNIPSHMSAMWVSQFECELSEYSPDIRICIHMSCQVLSNLLDKAVCFNCQWKAHLKNDLVLNRPSFGALSQGISQKAGTRVKSKWTCQIYWQSGIQESESTPINPWLVHLFIGPKSDHRLARSLCNSVRALVEFSSNWICQSCYMDFYRLLVGFVKIDVRISPSCYMYLSKLIHGFL